MSTRDKPSTVVSKHRANTPSIWVHTPRLSRAHVEHSHTPTPYLCKHLLLGLPGHLDKAVEQENHLDGGEDEGVVLLKPVCPAVHKLVDGQDLACLRKTNVSCTLPWPA